MLALGLDVLSHRHDGMKNWLPAFVQKNIYESLSKQLRKKPLDIACQIKINCSKYKYKSHTYTHTTGEPFHFLLHKERKHNELFCRGKMEAAKNYGVPYEHSLYQF